MPISAGQFLKEQFIVPQFKKKFIIMILGILFMGFFLSFLICIGWGTDPYSFQNKIISERIGWTFGNWQLLLNAVMFVIVILTNRRLIGFGTVANMVLIGYTSDFFTWLWRNHIPSVAFSGENLPLKIAVFAAALLGFVTAASFYMNADLGLSPYDALASIISTKLGRVPRAVSRIAYDMTAVAVGVLASLGSGIGIQGALIGSVAMALTLGPMIQIVGRFVERRLLSPREP